MLLFANEPDSVYLFSYATDYSIIRDTKSKDVIVKMVNLLPVSVNASLDLSGIAIESTPATKTTLHGSPEEKNAKLVTIESTVSEKFNSELPAYSFTVIRMKAK